MTQDQLHQRSAQQGDALASHIRALLDDQSQPVLDRLAALEGQAESGQALETTVYVISRTTKPMDKTNDNTTGSTASPDTSNTAITNHMQVLYAPALFDDPEQFLQKSEPTDVESGTSDTPTDWITVLNNDIGALADAINESTV